MYHPSLPFGSQDARLSGFECITTFVPGGASGVALKSKFPNKKACADSAGFTLDPLSKFKVRKHWSRSLSHSAIG